MWETPEFVQERDFWRRLVAEKSYRTPADCGIGLCRRWRFLATLLYHVAANTAVAEPNRSTSCCRMRGPTPATNASRSLSRSA